MGVYNDMAYDAGERYGTEGNRQMAEAIEAEHYRDCMRNEEEDQMNRLRRELDELNREVQDLTLQLGLARGFADEANALLDECLKPVRHMAQMEQYNGSKKKAQRYIDLANEIAKRKEQ